MLNNSLPEIALRDIVQADISAVIEWQHYPQCFEELDYALRQNGWLFEYYLKPCTKCYAAEYSGELVGFAILNKTSQEEAEFRIALKPGKTGMGLGKTITLKVMEDGFGNMDVSRIHLIVRKNNQKAFRLYKKLGFGEKGECIKEMHGKQVDFFIMDIYKERYLKINMEKL